MTLDQLLEIARSEMMMTGELSKGVRMEVIHHALQGDQFDIFASTNDYLRIASSLQRTGNSKRLWSRKHRQTKHLHFNTPKKTK